MTPTYRGLALFGRAVSITMVPNANAAQIAAFFGVQGVQAMDGGSRGRVFEVEGLMPGLTAAGVQQFASILLSLAGPAAGTLTDTTGLAWPNVVFRNEFSWAGKYMLDCTNGGKCRAYKAVLHGLT